MNTTHLKARKKIIRRVKAARDDKGLLKIKNIKKKWKAKNDLKTLTPEIIDSFIRTIPNGQLTTISAILKKFAMHFNRDTSFNITTKLFICLSAWAAEKAALQGKSNITPYWRILKKEGKLNPKFPGGVRRQAEYLLSEGFGITSGPDDDSWKVTGHEKYLLNYEPL